jgi:acyl dehydratase
MTAVGDALPEVDLPLTATHIAAGAIATRDFMPVHHDRDYANGQGAPDIFMNIISTNAYCSRYLTDWAGAEAIVKKLAIRLGVPVFPGTVLRFRGTVTGVEVVDGEEVVDVELTAATDLGDHATGTAQLTLPV